MWERLGAGLIGKKDIIIQSFRQIVLTINIDGSEGSQIRVKDLPNLVARDWRKGRLGCNLDRLGKTTNGQIELNAEDDQMFD